MPYPTYETVDAAGNDANSLVYNTSAPTLTNGQEVKPQADVNGNMKVNVVAGGGSGLSVTDEATWTAGTSAFTPTGGAYNDSATALTSGQQGSTRLTPNRAFHVNLRSNSGTEIGTTSSPVNTSANSAQTTSVTLQNAASANGNGTVLTTTGMASARLQVTITGTATVNFEGTEDGSTYNALSAPQNGQLVSTTTATGMFDFNVTNLQNIRARISGASGSPSVTVTGVTSPVTQITHNMQVFGPIASGSTDVGNPVKVGGVYNSSNITLTNGQRGDAQLTANGFLRQDLGTLIAGEDLTNNRLDVEQHFSYAAINTATTTTVKSGAGFLHTITVTGGTAGTIVVYDNTAGSGTQIANFSSTNAIATYTLNVAFATGLTIVTGAATTLTVSYR